MRLTAEMVEALSGVYLSPRYDTPQPTPEFHLECWARYCSEEPSAATAAPRNHAKSTVLSLFLPIYMSLIGKTKNLMLVSQSNEKASTLLISIQAELQYNDLLINEK